MIMIKQNLAIISTIGKMHLEDVLATESNMSPKLLPTRKTNKERGFEGLHTHITNSSEPQLIDSCKQIISQHTLFNEDICLSSFSALSSCSLALLTSLAISSTEAPCLQGRKSAPSSRAQEISHTASPSPSRPSGRTRGAF